MNNRRVWRVGAVCGLLIVILGVFAGLAAAQTPTGTPAAEPTAGPAAEPTGAPAAEPAGVAETDAMTATEEATGTEAVSLTGDALAAQEIDALLSGMAEKNHFSGAVLIVRDGEPILNKGYGLANREWDIPNTPETRFRIAHLTHLFTAVAILQLQEEGLLDVQDSVCDYLDPCPEEWEPVTLHQLLIHTSGIPNYLRLPDVDEWKCIPSTPVQLLDRMAKLPLDFAPGEQQGYSNTGYIILGEIVLKVAKMPFARYLNNEILEPLGMTSSGLDGNGLILPKRASGYTTGPRTAKCEDDSVLYSARGMFSTTEDLLRFAQALHSDELLPQEALEPMFTPQVEVPGTGWENLRGAYGWFFQTIDGHDVIFHGGVVEGFFSAMELFPDEGLTVIVLSNRDDGEGSYGIADLLAEMFSDSE